MKHNKTATNVDLRANPGYTRRVWKFSALYLLRNVDLLKKQRVRDISRGWINPDILPSKDQKPSGLNQTIEDEDELMVDQENRRVHNRGPSSMSKKRKESKIKKVSVLRPEDFAPKPKVMMARPPRAGTA